jgi:hypothetical protein
MSHPLPFITLQSIIKESLPPERWVVEGLIAEGSRVLAYGEFRSYKTFGLLDLCLHVAAGQPWLGEFPIPTPRRVLYVDEEMAERTLRRRIKRLAMGMEQPPDDSNFRALSRHGVRLDRAGTELLLAQLRASKFDPEFIVIETLRRVFTGDENQAREVSEFWRSVEPIIKPGRTLIVSHHMKKPHPQFAVSARYRASGSTDLLGAVDDALAFERVGDEAAFTVEPVKCREAEEAEPFAVSIIEEEGDSGPMVLRYEGPRADFKAQQSVAGAGQAVVLELLGKAPEQSGTTKELLHALNTKLGTTQRTGERVLAALKKAGRVTCPKLGLYCLVASDG